MFSQRLIINEVGKFKILCCAASASAGFYFDLSVNHLLYSEDRKSSTEYRATIIYITRAYLRRKRLIIAKVEFDALKGLGGGVYSGFPNESNEFESRILN